MVFSFWLIFFVSHHHPAAHPNLLNCKPSNSFSKECIQDCKHCSKYHLSPHPLDPAMIYSYCCSVLNHLQLSLCALFNPRASLKCTNFILEKNFPHSFIQHANKPQKQQKVTNVNPTNLLAVETSRTLHKLHQFSLPLFSPTEQISLTFLFSSKTLTT